MIGLLKQRRTTHPAAPDDTPLPGPRIGHANARPEAPKLLETTKLNKFRSLPQTGKLLREGDLAGNGHDAKPNIR
jgi:hypothetical protein